jgi:hypothetical protein
MIGEVVITLDDGRKLRGYVKELTLQSEFGGFAEISFHGTLIVAPPGEPAEVSSVPLLEQLANIPRAITFRED